MQLEWLNHSSQLLEGVSELLTCQDLLDVTISAEGKKLRAHRVILSAASAYFKDVLTSDDCDKSPIIFMRDVSFSELQSLISFIYSGQAVVPGSTVENFLKLAKSLGVKGFSFEENNKENLNANKVNQALVKNKENGLTEGSNVTSSPFKKSSASEPINIPSHLYQQSPSANRNEIANRKDFDYESQTKKRRLQSKSLDEIIISPPTTFKSGKHLKTPSTPLSPLVLPSFWTSVPVALSSPGLPHHLSSQGLPNDNLLMKPPPPPYPSQRPIYQHSSHLSCPVDTESPKKATNNASNFSFDSGAPLLDPNELAAKGATLLHHLALWMIEEKKTKEIEEQKTFSRNQSMTTPAPAAAVLTGGHRHRGSECDRPDSGFDSKDEDESKNNISINNASGLVHQRHLSEAISEENLSGPVRSSNEGVRSASETSSSSPDTVTEISRQAPIRQPIIRKRRIQMN